MSQYCSALGMTLSLCCYKIDEKQIIWKSQQYQRNSTAANSKTNSKKQSIANRRIVNRVGLQGFLTSVLGIQNGGEMRLELPTTFCSVHNSGKNTCIGTRGITENHTLSSFHSLVKLEQFGTEVSFNVYLLSVFLPILMM